MIFYKKETEKIELVSRPGYHLLTVWTSGLTYLDGNPKNLCLTWRRKFNCLVVYQKYMFRIFLIKFDNSISSFHRLEVPEADPKPISRSPKQIWKQKIHTDSDEPEFKHPSGISKPEPLPLTVGSKANNLQGGLPGSAGLPSHYTQVRHQAPQLTVPVGSVIIVIL